MKRNYLQSPVVNYLKLYNDTRPVIIHPGHCRPDLFMYILANLKIVRVNI